MLFNLLAEQQADWTSYLMIGVLLVAIIGLFVWSSYSNKKKQKQAQEVVNNLKIGDRVKTIGGICGFVAEINDAENTFVLKTGMNGHDSYVKFDKGAIYQTAPGSGNANASAEKQSVEEKPAQEKTASKNRKPRAKKADAEKVEEVKEEVKEAVEEDAKTETPAE